MANFLPPAIIEIKALADKAIAEFQNVNKELDKMEGQAEKAGGGIAKMEKASKLATGALIGMGAAFAGFATIGIGEALEAEQVMNKLGSTMAALGLNTEKNRERISALTSSYVELGFADDAAAAGFEKLLRVTGDVNKSQELLALSADLARKNHIDLTTASSILAKAAVGNTKAFKEMGIELDTTLPRAQAIDKAFSQLNDKIGKQAEEATKTFAVQLEIVKERFKNTAETLGATLLPYLKQFLDLINDAIDYVKRNSEQFKILASVILIVTTALAAYNVGVKASIAFTKAWTILTTAQSVITAILTRNQQALNTAVKANPVGLIFTAVTLLIGGMTLLWNKSESFRKLVIQIGKVGLTAFSSIVPIIGQLYEAILKVISVPLKTLLGALSHLPVVGKYAKSGLDILNKGIEGVSDFSDKASKKAKTLAANLDKLNKPIKIGGLKGIDIPDMDNAEKAIDSMYGQLTAKEKAALQKKHETLLKEKAKQDAAIEKQNEAYLKTVEALQSKIEDVQKKHQETLTKAQNDHDEKVAKARSVAMENELKTKAEYAEKILEAETRRDELIAKAEAEAQKQRTDAQKTFNDLMKKMNQDRADDLAELERNNAENIQKIYIDNTNKLQSIINTSIDRLREAFKKGTEFSVTELFEGLVEAGKTSADELLEELKVRLSATQTLAKKASALAGLGFSQTFIEQVVSAGPEVGTQLADSILSATPATIKELQNTFVAMEKQTNTGLDALAVSMNKGANLATDELKKAYAEAQNELQILLAEQAKDYTTTQAKINKEFNERMGEAEKVRDAALASAESDLSAALLDIKNEFTKTNAELDKELSDSIADINKTLNDALAEAAKDLADATETARKDLSDALADISKEFDEKLTNIKNAIASTVTAIEALKTAMSTAQSTAASAASTVSGSTIATTSVTASAIAGPQVLTTATVPVGPSSVAAVRAGEEKSMAGVNINQTFNTDYVDPVQMKIQILNALKYGSTVEVSQPVTTNSQPSGGGTPRTGKYANLVD